MVNHDVQQRLDGVESGVGTTDELFCGIIPDYGTLVNQSRSKLPHKDNNRNVKLQ